MPEYDFKTKTDPEVLKAFETFAELISPKDFYRNLRLLYMQFLKIEDCGEYDYFTSLAYEVDSLFDLLEVMEDRPSEAV